MLNDEFKDESEFQYFLNIMKERLPVTFRINNNIPNYQNFEETISHPDFVKKMIQLSLTSNGGKSPQQNEEQEEKKEGQEEEIKKDEDGLKLQNISWYPNNLVWQLNTFKHEFKKNKAYESFHKYI